MSELIAGAIAVKAAILGGKRAVEEVIFLNKPQKRDHKYILSQATSRGLKISFLSPTAFEKLNQGKASGGILARISGFKYADFNSAELTGWWFYLQGIEDPFNFGYCLRSLLAAGCTGVLVDQRNWLSASEVVIQSSAGASEYLPLYLLTEATFAQLKQAGFSLIGSQRSEFALPLSSWLPPDKVLMVLGGEKRGISKTILKQLDQLVYIDYASDFKMALNGSSAASILAFQLAYQKIRK